jgi:hypothetical protein
VSALLGFLLACVSPASRTGNPIATSKPLNREYVVELQPWASHQTAFADSVAKALCGRVGHVYESFKGFSIWLPSDSAASKLVRMHDVKMIEPSVQNRAQGTK